MSIKVSQSTKLGRQKDALAKRLLENLKRRGVLQPGMRVGVAVSGGADSVALFLLLLEIREQLGIVLSVVHFNHKLRGRASNADEQFVAKLAEKHKLPFHLDSADVAAKALKEKSNLEDAARRARYDFFARLAARGDLTHVAVAHTADDQAETVLAHLLRGTGLAGLGGIHQVVGHVVRPLLGFRRADLRAYLKSKKQAWREDATNRDTAKLRARIRKQLLPLLEKKYQPAVVPHLAALAELAREDESLLKHFVEERHSAVVKQSESGVRIEIDDLLAADSIPRFNDASGVSEPFANALAKRVVRRIVQQVKRKPGELGAKHVDAVLEFAKRGQNGKSLSLPGGVEVRRERSALLFLPRSLGKNSFAAKKTQSLEYRYNVDLTEHGARVQIAKLNCAFRFRVIDWPRKRGETSGRGAVLDRNRLHVPLVVRNWQPGDKLQPLGHANPHKLKRLLNEKRVSRWERAGWPVLTSGGVVAWARGFPVAAEFAANERTQSAIVIAEEQL
jgi:tRNA(Ile)-lysidine synthase